jgi:hypothetical protein
MIELLIATITFSIGAGFITALILKHEHQRNNVVREASDEAKKILEVAGLTQGMLEFAHKPSTRPAEVDWELFEQRIDAILRSDQEPNVADVLRGCETEEWRHIEIGSEPFYVNIETKELMMESNGQITPCPHPNKNPVFDDDYQWECVWCEHKEPAHKHSDPGPYFDFKYMQDAKLRTFRETAKVLESKLRKGETIALPDGYTVEHVAVDQRGTVEPVIFHTGHTERIHT